MTMVAQVEHQIAAHDREANDANVGLVHTNPLWKNQVTPLASIDNIGVSGG
jgi:hypothetical protein